MTTKRTRTPSKRFPAVYWYETDRGRLWGATVELEPDWRTGKRITKRKQGFRTQDEAREWRIAEQDKRRRGDTLEPSMLPFGLYCEEWLAGLTMRPRSLVTYQGRIAHITKRIGDVPLSRVTTAMLDRVYAEMIAAGYAASTIRDAHSAVRVALRRAVNHRLITVNPAEFARPPEAKRTAPVTWTPDQMRAFLATAADDPGWGLLFRFLSETWARIGEAIDLRWDAVDLDAATIRIERTITLDSQRQRVSGTPKTSAGRRTIPISRELADWLRRHKDQQRFRGRGTDLVFPARHGGWLQQITVAQALRRMCERAGVPLVTPHGLRHIGGSLAYADGVSLKVISERLGHSSMTVTASIYISADVHQHRSAADQIGRMLGS